MTEESRRKVAFYLVAAIIDRHQDGDGSEPDRLWWALSEEERKNAEECMKALDLASRGGRTEGRLIQTGKLVLWEWKTRDNVTECVLGYGAESDIGLTIRSTAYTDRRIVEISYHGCVLFRRQRLLAEGARKGCQFVLNEWATLYETIRLEPEEKEDVDNETNL